MFRKESYKFFKNGPGRISKISGRWGVVILLLYGYLFAQPEADTGFVSEELPTAADTLASLPESEAGDSVFNAVETIDSVESGIVETQSLDTADSTIEDVDITDSADVADEDIILVDEEESEPQDSLPPIEKMPELKRFIEAEYPQEIYKQGIEGAVLLDLIVSDSGTVDSVAIVSGVNPVLDTNALVAARQFVFSPAIAGGVPVPVLLQYEYRYLLQEVVEKVEKYANFSGRVLEQGTKSPVSDALVVINFIDTVSDTALSVPFGVYRERIGTFEGQYLEENRLVTITDENGYFRFYSLPACTIEVKIPVPGYEEFGEREAITAGEAIDVVYRMQRISYSDYEIVVYGRAEEKEVSRRQLTLNEVKKIPGLGGDAVKVVQALPGVARPTFGISQIIVRGAPTNNSKFFLDGVEIPLLFHYGLKSTYNSDALEKVDFYPGGFGTRYGGAIGGVVEITGRRAKTDRWHGYLDANLLDGAVFVEGPINDKVSMLGQFRRSFIGDLIKVAAKNSPTTMVMTTAPYYWDYIARTDVAISDKHHSYLTLFGVKDGMELIVSDVRGGNAGVDEAKNSARAEVLFHLGIAGWEWDMSDILFNSLKYSVSYVKSDVSVFGVAKSETSYWQHYIRDQLSWKPSPSFLLNIGADIELVPLNLLLILPDAEGNINADTTKNWLFGVVGGYMNFEWRPIERLQIIPGLRYDFYPELDYSGANVPEFWDYHFDNTTRFSGEPAFRLTGRYEVVEGHVAKASAGTYSQTPQPIGQAIHETWGNPDLTATRASQYVVGHEWRITDLIHTDIQAYFNRQWDVARLPAIKELGPDMKPVVGNGKRRMKGVEVMLRHDQSESFFGWLAYSLSRSEQYNFDEERWVVSSKDQTHNLIAVGSWRLPMNWEAGFKLQFTTGDPATPVIGSEYDENNRFYRRINGETNSDRLDPTVQLDIRIDKKFIFKKWILSTYVDFYNIGYFLYKSPQMNMYDPAEPYDYADMRPNRRSAYQYSIPAIGIKADF